MNWTNEPATESRLGRLEPPTPSPPGAETPAPHVIKIGKITVLTRDHGKEVETEVFTMTVGEETIELLPLRNWGQLDVHKWTVRGKLPDSPAGLEVAFDHIKLGGETISIKDPAGCLKLEQAFEAWLALERQSLELAAKKAHAKPAPATTTAAAASAPPDLKERFQVEVDKRGQVHVHCFQGKETLATVGLSQPGFNSLISQGLLRKPHALKVGALHDWVELDGVLFSFEKGNNDAARLTNALNEHYIPSAAFGRGKEIVVFENAASSTGFDIQFPASVGGALDNHRRPLNEQTLELLLDPQHCGLVRPGLIIKLTRPALIFKQKTPDGGERYLEQGPESLVTVTDEDGEIKFFDLSKPLNYLHMSAVDLTAVFNHPAVNRHGTIAAPGTQAPEAGGKPDAAQPRIQEAPVPPAPATAPVESRNTPEEVTGPPVLAPPVKTPEPPPKIPPLPSTVQARTEAVEKPLPNLWLRAELARPLIRHDWFTCLVYGKLAERVGNSCEGQLGPAACWSVALGEVEDVADPLFKGVFLTEKGALGFLNQGHIARFYKEMAFVGLKESALEGIGVRLVAVGLDDEERIVFIVSNDYRARFGVPEQTVAQELARLNQHGCNVLSVKEALESQEPLQVVWTVPLEQKDPNDPQAVESARPVDNDSRTSSQGR